MKVMQLVMKTCPVGDIDVLVRTGHDFEKEIMSKFVSNGHEHMTQHSVEVDIRLVSTSLNSCELFRGKSNRK